MSTVCSYLWVGGCIVRATVSQVSPTLWHPRPSRQLCASVRYGSVGMQQWDHCFPSESMTSAAWNHRLRRMPDCSTSTVPMTVVYEQHSQLSQRS